MRRGKRTRAKLHREGGKQVWVGKRQELSTEELKRRARAVLLYYDEVHGIKVDPKLDEKV